MKIKVNSSSIPRDVIRGNEGMPPLVQAQIPLSSMNVPLYALNRRLYGPRNWMNALVRKKSLASAGNQITVPQFFSPQAIQNTE